MVTSKQPDPGIPEPAVHDTDGAKTPSPETASPETAGHTSSSETAGSHTSSSDPAGPTNPDVIDLASLPADPEAVMQALRAAVEANPELGDQPASLEVISALQAKVQALSEEMARDRMRAATAYRAKLEEALAHTDDDESRTQLQLMLDDVSSAEWEAGTFGVPADSADAPASAEGDQPASS